MKIKAIFLFVILFFLSSCFQTKKIILPKMTYQNSHNLSLQQKLKLFNFKKVDDIYIRIFKEENVLEVWIKKEDGKYHLFQNFPICTYSGELGPKVKEGDKQSPEGFYSVTFNQLNPKSHYHLSFNLGFPNQFDRANGYTGSYLMVHGECQSVGCYAMGNEPIEEIFGLIEIALKNGQESVPVHIFPFRMTESNLSLYKDHKWYPFWKMIQPAYEQFEKTKIPPKTSVIDGKYRVNKLSH